MAEPNLPSPSESNVPAEPDKPSQVSGVNISGGDVRVGGDIIGRDRIDIGTQVRLGSLRVFNFDVRWLPVVVLLVVIIGALGVYILYPRTPSKMTGEFNVAVASFTILDANGNPVNSEDGAKISNYVYLRLNDLFQQAGSEKIHYELWNPSLTGTVVGKTRQEREAAATALAEHIGAHILIYGAVKQAGADSELSPEFYVNYRGFTDAAEITGQDQLGAPLFISLPFTSNESQEFQNPALSARATALSLITIGLAYYSIDDYTAARDYLQRALDTKGWLDYAGKQVGYNLLGNANVRLASQNKMTEPLIQAMHAYTSALEIDPNYARGIAGKANVNYLIALGDPNNPSFDTLDDAALAQSEADFKAALAGADTPASANIPAKVHFGLGQVYFVRAAARDASLLPLAQQEFQIVVDEWKAGNASIAALAGHSFARLGLAARVTNDLNGAIEFYKQAIPLVSPLWQGEYNAALGDVYLANKQPEQARAAYTAALRIAEKAGDAASANKYQKKLSAVK